MANRKNTQFGSRLAALRRSASLSQADAATRAGIATETLSRIERGSQEVRIENLEKLAQVYGVSMADLFASTTRTPASESDNLVQEMTDLLRRQRPAALRQARKVLYALFDEEPPQQRIRKKGKPKKGSSG